MKQNPLDRLLCCEKDTAKVYIYQEDALRLMTNVAVH